MTKSITLPTGWNGGGGGGGGTGPAGPVGPQGIAGVDGKTVRNGSGAPSGAIGVDGDFYINTAAETIYGPKTAGAWGSPTALIGPAGATGPAGSTGSAGSTGAKGDKGDPGTDGATGPAGPGVATGGTTGQVLVKNSATNYDTGWTDPAAGGAVASVDGRTGVVVLSDKYVDVGGDTMTGNLIVPNYVTTGNAALTGKLRLPQGGNVASRNAANTADINLIYLSGSDVVMIGGNTNISQGWASIGATVAQSGTLRFANTGYVAWRNAANSADIAAIQVDATDTVIVGGNVTPVKAATVALNSAAAATPQLTQSVAGTLASEMRANAFGIGIGTGALAAASGAAVNNVAVGTTALTASTTASHNTAIGANAGGSVTTGSQNTLIGKEAGVPSTASYQLTTGSNNTLIGYQAGASAGTQQSSTVVVGHLAKSGSNQTTVVGQAAWASGASGVSIGYNSQAGASGVAIGAAASANAGNAVCIGAGVTTSTANQFVLGLTNHLLVIPGPSVSFPTAAGTKIGLTAVEKLALWGATPVVQPAGWSATAGYTATKTFNPESTTLTEVARVLGTLVDTLKLVGLVGA